MEKKDPLEIILERNPDLIIPDRFAGLDLFTIIGKALYRDLEKLYFTAQTEYPIDLSGFEYSGRASDRYSPYNIYGLWDNFPDFKESNEIFGTIDNSRRNKESILRAILGLEDCEKLPSSVTIRKNDAKDMEVYQLR